MTDADPEKARRELERQLALLAERPAELPETLGDPPRGALPALFRAARAARPDARPAVVRLLAARLHDLPLAAPSLELAGEEGLAAPFVETLRELAQASEAWCAVRQAAALEPAAGAPGRLVELLAALLADAPWDPTELALEAGVGPVCDALREVLRLRLQSPARRRDRASVALARGALRALARMIPDDAAFQATLAQVVAAEARRAGKDEPVLALEALEALAAAPPFQRLRLIGPLLRAVERPKVRTRLEAALERAAGDAGVGPEELAELSARTGGLEADGRARVALDEGDALLWVDASGEVVREPAGALSGPDARVVEAATRDLEAARGELTRRLEAAMVARRAWTAPVWRALFQGEHPLWAELAPRALWELRAPSGARAFALGARGPEDLFGEAVDLDAPDARVGLVHPVLLADDELELWRERAIELAAAGERRLVAAFPQLHRAVAPAAPDAVQRFVGREAYRQVLGDVAREGGWKGFPLQGSAPWELERAFGPARARLVVDDVPLVVKKVAPTRRTKDDDDDDGPRPRRRGPKRPPPPEAAPRVRLTAVEWAPGGLGGDDERVALAEVVRDLEALTDGLAGVDELFLRTWQQRKWKDQKEAWREVVLRYRQASPAVVAVRKGLLAALARREGLALRLEDRFAIAGTRVIELHAGLVHQGAAKDHLPLWKVEEELGSDADRPIVGLPFEPAADPDTVEVVTRVLALARRAAAGGA
ncbi:MAG: DUF4132 domain-containing protein [Planctomycetes bacterium]|nr:DUF4132 domain-containing protein [Planctomycetota bacterium]